MGVHLNIRAYLIDTKFPKGLGDGLCEESWEEGRSGACKIFIMIQCRWAGVGGGQGERGFNCPRHPNHTLTHVTSLTHNTCILTTGKNMKKF